MSQQITVTNPRTKDVRVIPVEIEKTYLARGWEKSKPAKSDPK